MSDNPIAVDVAARAVLAEIAKVEDAEGRAIWMTAEEVELDQWVGRLTTAAGVLSDSLNTPPTPGEPVVESETSGSEPSA